MPEPLTTGLLWHVPCWRGRAFFDLVLPWGGQSAQGRGRRMEGADRRGGVLWESDKRELEGLKDSTLLLRDEAWGQSLRQFGTDQYGLTYHRTDAQLASHEKVKLAKRRALLRLLLRWGGVYYCDARELSVQLDLPRYLATCICQVNDDERDHQLVRGQGKRSDVEKA